jgi:peptidoglycan biosynthesis protein MviN/MurJ (putative lipid II flippase)
MTEESTTKPGAAFWIIAIAFALWNLVGLMFYVQQSSLTPDRMQELGLTAQQIAHIANTPAWGHSGYAIAVNAGLLGAILLLLRKAWAVPLFILSLVGALVQDLDAIVLRDAMEAWGPTAWYLPVFVLVICGIEIWYSMRLKAKGWIS